MILTCPHCSRRFLIDEGSLTESGRDVCCTLCQHTWFQTPSGRPRDVYASTGLKLTPLSKPVARTPWGWLFYGFVWVLVISLGIFARETWVNSWPPLKHLYDLFQLPTPLNTGFVHLEKVRAYHVIKKGQPKLLISGAIVNSSDHTVDAPTLYVRILSECPPSQSLQQRFSAWLSQPSKGRCEVARFSFRPTELSLEPGQRFMFEAPSQPVPAENSHAILEF